MTDKLYRIETTGTIENPKMNGSAMLYCNDGIAFVKLHPVKLKAKPKRDIPEVATGRWTWNNLHDDDFQTLVCSNCFSSEGASEFYNYCPNCGAQMRNGIKRYD